MNQEIEIFLAKTYRDEMRPDPSYPRSDRYTKLCEEKAQLVLRWWVRLSPPERETWRKLCSNWSSDSMQCIYSFSGAFSSDEICAGMPWQEFRVDVWRVLRQIGFIYWREDYEPSG